MHDVKSCTDLANNGIIESGEYDLDVIDDQKPITAWCNLPKGRESQKESRQFEKYTFSLQIVPIHLNGNHTYRQSMGILS